MAYNGYTNEATYFTALMVDNERALYDRVRAISREHEGNPAAAASAVRHTVTGALNGTNRLLVPGRRQAWNTNIRMAGGLGSVNWVEIAESEGEARRRNSSSGASGHHSEKGELHPGVRVQLHPGTDWWMRGARYGEVTKVGRTRVHVRLDATGTVITLPFDRVKLIDGGDYRRRPGGGLHSSHRRTEATRRRAWRRAG